MFAKNIDQDIKAQIMRGISPVEGEGKYKQYSKSYVDQITGKASFFKNKNGKLVVIKDDPSKKMGRGARKALKEGLKITSLKNIYGKRKSPVSMSLSGDMLKSLKVKKRFLDGISIQITDKKSEYHNEGNNKLPRRALLPKEGEEFSRLIQQKIRKALEKAVNQVFRR